MLAFRGKAEHPRRRERCLLSGVKQTHSRTVLLLNMTRAWLLLAEQAEENNETGYGTHGIQHD